MTNTEQVDGGAGAAALEMFVEDSTPEPALSPFVEDRSPDSGLFPVQTHRPSHNPPHPDVVRLELLRFILIIFAAVLGITALGALLGGHFWTGARGFYEMTGGAVTGITGAVVGYYFRDKTKE